LKQAIGLIARAGLCSGIEAMKLDAAEFCFLLDLAIDECKAKNK
jgi:hypothetical protein